MLSTINPTQIHPIDDINTILCNITDTYYNHAVIKVIAGDYTNTDCVENTINYVASHPIENGLFGEGCSFHPDQAIQDFYNTKSLYNKLYGKQVKHIIIAFQESDLITPETLPYIAYSITSYFYGRFQVYYGIHSKRQNGKTLYHIHQIINTVNYANGYKFQSSPENKQAYMKYIESLPFNIKLHPVNNYY